MSADAADTPRDHYRTIAGREVLVDGEGFLVDADVWTREIGEALSREMGLAALTDEHWRVIRFLRAYRRDYGRMPLNREVRNGTGLPLSRIEAIFPGGIKNGARLIAGLPNPRGCA